MPIELTQGRYAFVDAIDFPPINKFNWHFTAQKYAARGRLIDDGLGPSKIRMHTQIIEGVLGSSIPDGFEADHANGNRTDNRRSNLRVCDRAENKRNSKKHRNCASPYKGVSFRNDGRSKPWVARITMNKRTIALGHHKSEIEAAIAYDRAAFKYFKEFARLNFSELVPE